MKVVVFPGEEPWTIEKLLLEMVGDYHQTGMIRDHVDPSSKSWDVNPDWRICEDILCVAARRVENGETQP